MRGDESKETRLRNEEDIYRAREESESDGGITVVYFRSCIANGFAKQHAKSSAYKASLSDISYMYATMYDDMDVHRKM